MRLFRIALPLLNVILGVALFYWGDMQVRRIIVARGSVLEEGLTDVAAEARYVHYALNAPAWALLRDTRDKLWSRSTYWTGHDLYYFLVVIVMWFSIGFALDKRSSGEGLERVLAKPLWKRILASVCVFWGLFTCYSIFPRKPDFVPLSNYLSSLLSAMTTGGYGWWWYPLGLAWSLGLVALGLYFVFGSKRGNRIAVVTIRN